MSIVLADDCCPQQVESPEQGTLAAVRAIKDDGSSEFLGFVVCSLQAARTARRVELVPLGQVDQVIA